MKAMAIIGIVLFSTALIIISVAGCGIDISNAIIGGWLFFGALYGLALAIVNLVKANKDKKVKD
jgi:hypothetical protein